MMMLICFWYQSVLYDTLHAMSREYHVASNSGLREQLGDFCTAGNVTPPDLRLPWFKGNVDF